MIRYIVLFAVLALSTTAEAAARQDVGERLRAAGAPDAFVAGVTTLVTQAAADGLPVAPLESKALEGWAKRSRVPAERVMSVLQELRGRLTAARDVTVTAGLTPPPGDVVAAAAEALGRGLSAEQVRDLVAGAPAPASAAAGLTVAASLAAQGLARDAAVAAVQDAWRQGRAAADVFELPSVVADLLARGVPMSDVARQILEGGGLPAAAGGAQGRPGAVAGPPPGKGPVDPPRGPPEGRGRRNN